MQLLTRIINRCKYSQFRIMFNNKTNEGTGRSLLLLNNFLLSFTNVFITGVFYTGFLTINGIDIVSVGIIAFIPYISWIFSLLSPKLLSHFKKRKALLVFNHFSYYFFVVLATTIMPMFVTDTGQRTLWFGILLFVGNLINALLGSGNMAWHIHFIPSNEHRNIFFSYMNLASVVTSTVIGILASFVADAVQGTSMQASFIFWIRIAAFVLILADGLCLYLIPKEYPYSASQKQIRMKDLIIEPLRANKFMLTAVIFIAWNFICNINANTWTYYVLNTMDAGYMLTYVFSAVLAICTITMQRVWLRSISRFSWFKTMVFCIAALGVLEFAMSFATHETIWVYVIVASIQGMIWVGVNLLFASLFYINLPKDCNCDVFITFWNLIANISILLGSIVGTAFISWTENQTAANGGPWRIFGLNFYGSQFLVWIKGGMYLLLALYILKIAHRIKPDEES